MLTIERQCELLGIPRSTYYYKPKPKDPAADGMREAAMRAIDDIHLEMPFAGARKISKELKKMGFPYGRHATKALMDEMNVHPVYPKPNLSKPRKGAKRHPYLLKSEKTLFPNQVWATDITYIPIGRTHMYLVAVIDWFSRYIVGWRLLDDMGAAGVVACMRDAIEEHGAPAIANSDQGSVCSSAAYEQLLEDAHVLQSMDGKARWVDNVIVEHWFRSLKSECVKIEEYETPRELRGIIDEYVRKYNNRRTHESLDYETPASWYYSGIAARQAA